ncbi:hypothetical protein J437_LFUL005602 [Ladona fulva]|uniref:Transmembrane protein 45B n=1 Tax=Ladona fulva TaxID=123851 RepID=A0A8K0K1U6_LADFU|nr:hypothetical protein J437_LFUL005602 [Ladona fulva]
MPAKSVLSYSHAHPFVLSISETPSLRRYPELEDFINMGSFLGHLVPGLFFTLFPLWWIYSIFRRYFITKKFHQNGEKGYLNTVSFPCRMCDGRIPVEGLIKLVSVIIGVIGEAATAFENGKFAHLGNVQHITMYSFFGFSGILDILYHWQCRALPPDLDYVAAFLAFAAEGFIFFNHLHRRTPMDIQIHMMLFVAIVACALAVLLELKYRRNVLAALARSYFTLLQGTWFFQVGFILYPPFPFLEKWEETNHKQMMVTTLLFTWHAAAHVVVVLGIGFWVFLQVEKISVCPENEFMFEGDSAPPLYQRLSDNKWFGVYKDDDDDLAMSRVKRRGRNEAESAESEIEAI